MLNAAASAAWTWKPILFGMTLTLSACGSALPIFVTPLSDAPVLFAGDTVDPFTTNTRAAKQILYVTQREPGEDKPYSDTPASILRVGSAQVQIGPDDYSDQELFAESLSSDRRNALAIEIGNVNEFGPLGASRHPAADPTLFREGSRNVDKRFTRAVNDSLAQSPGKDIVVYVHGVRSDFQNPLLVASELRHFSGYRDAYIGYSWPASTGLLDYLEDSEDSSEGSFQFRRFIRFLAAETDARRIHIVAYSAGTRMVIDALGEFALQYTDKPTGQIRRDLELGQVMLISSDATPARLGTHLIEGVMRLTDSITIYQSGTDNALRLSNVIFRGTARLGQSDNQPLPPHVLSFLEAYPNLNIIDVSNAEKSNTANGHRYLRESPWVSSDIISSLTYDLSPQERGLVRDPARYRWTFPKDYPERLRPAVLEKFPSLDARASIQ